MRRFLKLAGIALVFVVSAPPQAWGHPHHVSVGMADWIEETQSIEMALNVSVIDLEEVLSKRQKRALELDGKSKEIEKVLQKYFLSCFRIERADKVAIVPKWIGYEIEDDAAWIYLEIPFGRPSMKGCKIYHGVLIQEFEEQVNLLHVKRGKQRKTLKFRKRDPWQKLPAWH